MSENVSRWTDELLREQWKRLLLLSWADLRALLLAETEQGAALRQNAPLGGILPPTERTRLMREFSDDPRAA